MTRDFCTCICLTLVATAIPLRAATRPHAGTESQTIKVWTNADLEKLHAGLISITSQVEQNPDGRHAEQATRLRDELDHLEDLARRNDTEPGTQRAQ